MSRTNIEINDELIRRAMRQYGLKTKRQAVDLALRRLVEEALTTEEMLALQGSGWDGDLDEMRSSWRPAPL